MKVTTEKIEEIAELLDAGMICFYHIPSQTIEFFADPEDPFSDIELWQDVIDKIEDDAKKYIEFERMDSRARFKIMEDFAHSIADEDFKNQALIQLAKRKPFRNFKNFIERSKYRQEWFYFKNQACINDVKRQIESINL